MGRRRWENDEAMLPSRAHSTPAASPLQEIVSLMAKSSWKYMRKLKMACLNTEKVDDRFHLILNERQHRHSTTGRESENKRCTCAAIQQVKWRRCAKGDAVNGTG